MKVWAHTLIKNEEKYIWYVLMSAVKKVDRILVWDTGSTDNTVNIVKKVKKLYPHVIDFREIGDVDADTYTKARQAMLEETKSDWFMILDGDEIWWDESINEVLSTIHKNGTDYDSIVTPYINLLGDLFHYRKENREKYQIDEKVGAFTIRFMNRSIPGLFTDKPHGQHGYFDEEGVLIQQRDRKKRVFIDAPFMHLTHLLRSSTLASDRLVAKRNIKYKYEVGIKLPLDYYYPESFFLPRPAFVPEPWYNINHEYKFKAYVSEIPRRLKGYFWKGKSGY